jgi:hypothetical protein
MTTDLVAGLNLSLPQVASECFKYVSASQYQCYSITDLASLYRLKSASAQMDLEHYHPVLKQHSKSKGACANQAW